MLRLRDEEALNGQHDAGDHEDGPRQAGDGEARQDEQLDGHKGHAQQEEHGRQPGDAAEEVAPEEDDEADRRQQTAEADARRTELQVQADQADDQQQAGDPGRIEDLHRGIDAAGLQHQQLAAERVAGGQLGPAGGQSLDQTQIDRLLAVDGKEAAAARLPHGVEDLPLVRRIGVDLALRLIVRLARLRVAHAIDGEFHIDHGLGQRGRPSLLPRPGRGRTRPAG